MSDENDDALTAAQQATSLFTGNNAPEVARPASYPGQDAINAAQPSTGVTSPGQEPSPVTITSPAQVPDAGPANPVNPMAGMLAPTQAPVINSSRDDMMRQLNQDEQRKHDLEVQNMAAQGGAMTEQAQGKINEAQAEADLIAKTNKEYQDTRNANTRIAANETANMMEKITTAFQRQPDPTAYFHEDSLRSGLWLLSVAATAIANSNHPERANQMLQLAMQERDKNVEIQKEGIRNMQEGVKMEASAMERAQGLRLADIKDDHELKIASTNALMKVMQAKAAMPGPATLKAAYSQMALAMETDMTKTATEFQKQQEDSYNKAAERQNARNIEGMKIRSAQDLQKSAQDFEINQKLPYERETGERKSRVEVGAGAIAKVNADKQVLDPAQTGFSTGFDKNGKPIAPVIRGVSREDIHKVGTAATEAYNNYKIIGEELEKLDKEGGIEKVKDFTSLPPRLKSALIANGFSIARAAAGGRLSTQEAVMGREIETGADLTKIQDRALVDLYGRTGDVRALVKERMNSLPKQIETSMANGLYNPEDNEGRTIHFNPPDTVAAKETTPTVNDQLTRMGAGKQPPAEPTTAEELRAAEKQDAETPGSGLRQLHSDANQAIEDSAKIFKGADDKGHPFVRSPDTIRTAVQASTKNIIERGTPNAVGDGGIPEDERKAAANRIKLQGEEALGEANKKWDAIVNEKWTHKLPVLYSNDKDTWKSFALDEGLDIEDTAELEKLANEAKRRVKEDPYEGEKALGFDGVKSDKLNPVHWK